MGSKIEKTKKSRMLILNDWLKGHAYEIIAILIMVIGAVLFGLHREYDSSKPIDGGLWGQYGSYVGGLVGSLLAYVSIRLLNRNLQEQIIANNELRNSNDNSRRVAALQQFDSSFSTLIEMYRDSQSEVKSLSKEWVKNFKSTEKDYKKRVAEATEAYYKFYADNRSLLASYFRFLYRIMQIIDEAKVDEDTKRRYAKIFRCQLTEYELLLLRYNASTHYGKKMQVYINRYNLLKHLPKMHLVEFQEPSIIELTNKQEELYDHIFVEIRKALFERLSRNVLEVKPEKDLKREKLNIDLDNFKIELSVSKTQVRIDLVYVMARGGGAKISDTSLQLLMNFFMNETFVYASFGQYQTLDSLEFSSDIKTERNSRKHTVWVQVKSKEHYELVLSQGQLNEPPVKVVIS